MKPFNLEEAKAGKSVITRDGRNVRIVSFNTVGDEFPITAMVKVHSGEDSMTYTTSGKYFAKGAEHRLDLFMADDEPETEASELQKWCKEILPIVQAAANGEEIEIKELGNKWKTKTNATFTSDVEYRIKPKVKTVNGFEVPMHETVEPNHAQEYFTPSLAASNMWTSKRWGGYKTDKNLLDRGLVYIDKESAVKCAKAMLGINPEGEE